MIDSNSTDFGFQAVSPEEKSRKVSGVFSSVANNYDLMNDLMSGGMHRLWKRFTVHVSQVKAGSSVLDVAGGTGDMAILYRTAVGDTGKVIISDINSNMLSQGRDKLIDYGCCSGIDFVQANAESLPFKDNTFDCVSMAFGLRNVTDKSKALVSIFEKLKYGGNVIILEFSTLVLPVLQNMYDKYSFKFIPVLGKWVANDKGSYQYLVESIRMHPDQETLKEMMVSAGFSSVSYFNLSGGIVAVHKGYKI